jgi:hypothetical protein
VKVIGQNTDRYGFKRTAPLDFSIAITETIYVIDEQVIPAVSENDREKENAAFDLGSNVLRRSASCHRATVGTARRAPLPTLRFRLGCNQQQPISRGRKSLNESP